MDKMKEGRTTWLDGRIVIRGKEKKAARESRKPRGKEGLSVTPPPPRNPSTTEAEAERFKANLGYTEQQLCQKWGRGNHCLVEQSQADSSRTPRKSHVPWVV